MIRPWRRALQWMGALLFFSLPFLRWDGLSLLRLDLPSGTLFFFGRQLRLEEFYLLGLLLLASIFLLLLTTMVLGRVWCGWLCPQTWLNNLAEWSARKLGLKVTPLQIGGAWPRKLLLHLLYLALALLVGATLVWYFVAPEIYWQRLRAGELGPWPAGFTLVVGVLIYLDLAFLRRLACREFCPYGRFQTILIDRGTLTLGLTADHARRCLNCRACLRACPNGIDIRRGFQVECINCGNCRDACRRVMARAQPGKPGLIEYRFGDGEVGWKALFTPRLLLVGLMLALALSLFFHLAGRRRVVSLQVARLVTVDAGRAAVVEDGPAFHRFRAQVANRSSEAGEYRLVVRWEQAEEAPPVMELTDRQYLPLVGQGGSLFTLAANQRRSLLFAVALPPSPHPGSRLFFALLDQQGREHGAVLLNWTP